MNSAENFQENKQQKLYSISIEELIRFPEKIEMYKPGEKITRAKFASFLLYSFALSQGSGGAQALFFEWLKLRHGLDYSTMLQNFRKAGGYEILSQEEKKLFKEKYMKVAKHREVYREEEHNERIKDELMNIEKFIHEKIAECYINKKSVVDNLKNINDFKEFQAFIRNQITYLRANEGNF